MRVKKLGTDFYVTLATLLTFVISGIIYIINLILLGQYGDNPEFRDVGTVFGIIYSILAFSFYIVVLISSLCNGLIASYLSTKKKIGYVIIGFDILIALGNIIIPLYALIWIFR